MPTEGKEEHKGVETGEVSLVQAVAEHVYGSQDFGDTFEQWVNDHCSEYDLDAPEGEHRLRYTELYKRYQELFEQHVEHFIADKGSTVLEFYDTLRAAMEEDPDSEEAQFAHILSHLADYDIFIRMLEEAAITRRDRMRRSSGEQKEMDYK